MPFHNIVLCFLCLFVIVYIIWSRKSIFPKRRWLWIAITTFIISYLFIILYTSYLDTSYQNELNSFDLNKDGLFTGEEINFNQKEALAKVGNDTARNLVPISGLLYAFLLALPIFVGGQIYEKVRKTKSLNNK